MIKRLRSILFTLGMALFIVPASVSAESEPVMTQMNGEAEIRNSSELEAALADENRAKIKLDGNIEVSGSLSVSRTVTLDLNGYTLTSSETDGDIFLMSDNGNLTITDSGIDGKIDGQNKNCGFYFSGGSLTLESGSIVNCKETDGDGGAADLSSGSSFTMNGGAIRNCKADDDGGVVDIGKGCTFIMNGGIISGCRADDEGGVVIIKGNASFVMNGGTIENCSAGYNGGAVNIYGEGGSFTMTDGIIKDCWVDDGGLGNAVYGRDDKVIVSIFGGMIENCGVSPLSFKTLFTVSFDSDGGTPVAEQKVLNSPAVRPEDPTKAGYIFEGWYVDETPFDFSAHVAQNMTVIAKWSECDHAGSTEQPTCTDPAICTICKGTLPATGHTFIWQSGNGQYWKTCSSCDYETEKKAIPELIFNAPDTVCRTQDTIFSFTLPEGCRLITAGYEFKKIGGDLDATLENGQYIVRLSASGYPVEETSFKITIDAETVDGFAIKAEKTIAIQEEHSGGTATCKDKAKCEVCGSEYGELAPKNHADFKYFPAKESTKNAEGNIEYWYCKGCNKYYSDKDGTKEIKKADTVTAKLKEDSKTPQTGDTSNFLLWFTLLFVSGGIVIGSMVVSRKKKYSE